MPDFRMDFGWGLKSGKAEAVGHNKINLWRYDWWQTDARNPHGFA